MTDINTRGKLPFTIVSSSVNTGYATQLTSSVGYNIDIVNHHKDEYGGIENSPLQGPFTAQHVGGNQHRHVKLNNGSDDSDSRPEAYIISASAGSVKVYGPDINGIHKPRSLLTRDTTAKSPVNIKNIQTSGNIAGNFEHNYQVVQSVGRRITNNLINDEFIASGSLTTQFVSSSRQIYGLPEIQNNSKSIFVERFNAPGGKEVSSRGALDREGEEYAPNNSLTTRNIKVRQPYYNKLTQHAAQFNSGSTYKLLPDTGSVNAVTIHGINRNTLQKVFITGTSYFTGSKHDNFWVQHAIPRTDLKYKWIANSVSSSQQPIEYQSYNLPYSISNSYNSNGAFTDLEFEQKGPFGDHLGISGAIDKDEMHVSTYTNTMYRDRKYFEFDSTNTYVDLSNISSDITEKDFTISFWMKSDGNINYDLATATLEKSKSIAAQDSTPQGIFFKPDGASLYMIGSGNDKIYQYTLSIPWDIDTISYVNEISISGETTGATGLYIKPDGFSLYISGLGTGGNLLTEYSLGTAWDISTAATPIAHSFLEDSSPNDIYFKPDGTKVYIPGDQTDAIYEKTLSVPWNLTTTGSAVFASNALITQPRGLNITPDGKRLIVLEGTQRKIYYFTLHENWNLNSGLSLIPESYHQCVDNAPLGLFISEYKQKIYYTGATQDKIFQVSFDYEPIPLLQYSGSSSDNNVLLEINPSSSNIILNGTTVQNNIKSSPIVNDGKWHLITVVSDLSSTTQRIRFLNLNNITNTTVTKIYVDGGLATEATQQYLKLDISGLFLSSRDNINLGRSNYNLHDIMLWDSILTEEQINEVYRVSNISYGQPKKYLDHKLDKSIIPRPKHVYSARINKDNLTLADEVGSKNATLINFTASVNLQPQNTGIISYSTYFNGPYQGASWKSIRNAEHPVTRKLTTENTNIISTLIPPNISSYRGEISQKVVTGMGVVERIIINSRKNGTILNVKESPIYINNKPLKHKFILKDSQNTNVGFELTHTYANNLQYFASNQLNLTLGLGKKERQIYDSLLEYYNGSVDPNENPIDRLVGYTYNEIIFPKPGQALLKDVRQRTDYITDQPGYSIDGYDRQLGTQRVFWRNSQQDRMRTVNSYINSLGYTYDSIYLDLPFQTPSVAALEYISESNNLEYQYFTDEPTYVSIIDFSYKNCSELLQNYQHQFTEYLNGGALQSYERIVRPVRQVPELYIFEDVFSTSRINQNVILNNTEYPNSDPTNPASLRIFPNFIFEHAELISTSSLLLSDFSTAIYKNSTNDLGLNRLTEKISGKNPWYDSYEDYYVDVKTLSNDNLKTYSKIPEFKISEQISQLVGKHGGDATKITLQKYLDDLQFNYKSSINRDNDEFCDEDTINIVIDGVKKLLPYNGFYPQDRSLQLVNYLKESYLDTNAVGGGIYLRYPPIPSLPADEKITDGKLAEYYKISSFLEPLYTPGIFYNLIKSGIAVDWSIYTGSLPGSFTGVVFTSLEDKPKFRISFEDLINLNFLNSSSVDSQNRFIKYKEVNLTQNAGDFTYPASAYFDGYFTSNTSSQSSPLYTLSINNFLAETINFFLKDSSLNTFISKPDSDFLSFQEDKTYYMDIVLRKNNITMCEAHSSSLADSYGKMSGRYFGPSFWTGSAADETRISTSRLLAETLRDPGYCAYTPPYYYGDSIARISFKPEISSKYTVGEILDQMQIEFINTGFINDNIYASGSLYSSFVMPIESSVTIKGQIEDRQQTVQLETLSRQFSRVITNNLRNLAGTATNSTGIKKWVISPKMETPVLDFSNQEFITSTNILTRSYTDEVICASEPSHTFPTASGFGRGMWSGYGEIPQGDKGIFLELKESYPRQLVGILNPTTNKFETTNTASLLQACGFQQTNDNLSKKIGELADSRDISEAIVIIPYLLDRPIGRPIELGGRFSSKTTNDTVQIEGHNFIKIDQQIFKYQKTNLFANKPAVSLQDYDLGVGNIQETSISRMIGLMSKYILPPNFDFLINDQISPFVMYIAEFTSNLDKQDLADVWQGVMPKIAMRAEREKQVISHKNTQFDFFHGQGLPKDVKFMIFKAKKRAEINYYKMTSDSSDDGLFPSIQAGKPPSPYSFNWPYDYCSLVETATVNVEIEYINNSGSNTQ
jgi:sugar lactone lactonase YvrE